MTLFLHMIQFKSKQYIFFVLFSLICFNVFSADLKIDQIVIKDDVTLDSKKLILNGVSFRKVGFFKVKVWLSALYLEKKSTDSDAIIKSNEIKSVILHPLYKVSAEDSVKGWKLAFDKNCQSMCDSIKDDLHLFLNSIPDFKIKDVYIYSFSDQGFKYTVNGQEIFKSNNIKLAQVILSTWIGPLQPEVEIKNNLLGLTSFN